MQPIEVQEHVQIMMSDGCILSATIWLPVGASSQKIPAILEYLPYRKRDGTAIRDALTHPYLAAHGYACLRVDMRGSGESEGLLLDEYLPQEQQDCVTVIRWIAQQPWSNGNVGMMGISWGGFNSLQVAALRPPELKAIVSLCSTDDRYNTDIHYMGNCLLTDNFQWSSTMLAMMSRSPDPDVIGGEKSRELWLNRIHHMPFFASIWMNHPKKDAYWKQGSISEHWEDITCAVYLVGGFADGYASTIPRMLSNLRCPRIGLIGPWAHMYPHFGVPGPQIGFLQQIVRWFDNWLKDDKTDVMNPMLITWMQNSIRPQPYCELRPGRWIAEKTWPSENTENKIFFLRSDGLWHQQPTSEKIKTHLSPQTVGEAAGAWCGYGLSPEKPLDQRVDDGRSICFDMEALSEPVAIFGAPVIELDLSVDQRDAFIAVRLNEVFPDGASTRITYGLLNLTDCVIPGERTRVRIELNTIAHVFSKGNQLRVAISTTYWPLVWPSPKNVYLTVFEGASHMTLPVYVMQINDHHFSPFEKPESAPPLALQYIRPASGTRHIHRDLNGLVTYTVVEDSGHYKMLDHGLEIDYIQKEIFTIEDHDPLSAKLYIETIIHTGRNQWQTRTETRSSMTANEKEFQLNATITAYENNQLVLNKILSDTIARIDVITELS